MSKIFQEKWYETVPMNFFEFVNDAKRFLKDNADFGISQRMKITCSILGIPRNTDISKILIACMDLYQSRGQVDIDSVATLKSISQIPQEYYITLPDNFLERIIEKFGIYDSSKIEYEDFNEDLLNQIHHETLIIPALIYLIMRKVQDPKFVYELSAIIYNDYKQVSYISSGAYGEVWIVEKDGVGYADKQTENVDINELNILSTFDHPNVIRLHDFFFDNRRRSHMILPLADETLEDVIDKGGIDQMTMYMWMYQLTSALHFFHKHGYYHCDIKPTNILMRKGVLYLADFGISYPDISDMDFCGTPSWTSPEGLYDKTVNFSEQQIIHKISDIYSLGLVLFYMVSGKSIMQAKGKHIKDKYDNFTANYKFSIDSDVKDKKLASLIKRMCNPVVSERIHTTDEVLSSDFFQSLNYQVVIPGSIRMMNHLGSISDDMRSNLIEFVSSLAGSGYNLCFMYVLVFIYKKAMQHFESSDYTDVRSACLYIVSSVFYMEKIGTYTEIVTKILCIMSGMLRPPTLHDVAVSYQESYYGLMRLIQNDYTTSDEYLRAIEIDHLEYCRLETAEMIRNRRDKNDQFIEGYDTTKKVF